MKEYYKNSYLKEIDTKIINILDKDYILVKDIITYEEKGGQSSDIGLVNDKYEFITIVKDNDVYIKIDNNPFKVGDIINIKIDWNHRYNSMKIHSAQHLLSGLLYKYYNIQTKSVHMQNNFSIETDQKEIEKDIILDLEKRFNKAVSENKKIKSYFIDDDNIKLRRSIKVKENIRIVEIEDYDKIACGGLHVNSTSEIGPCYYLNSEKVRGHIRLFFIVGSLLDDKVSIWRKNSDFITKLTSSCDNKHIESIDKVFKEKKELEYKVIKYQKEIIENKLSNNILIEEVSDIDLNLYFQVTKNYEDVFICAIKKLDNKYNFIIIDKNNRINNLKDILIENNAKGSFKDNIYRGIIDFNILDLIRKNLNE